MLYGGPQNAGNWKNPDTLLFYPAFKFYGYCMPYIIHLYYKLMLYF